MSEEKTKRSKVDLLVQDQDDTLHLQNIVGSYDQQNLESLDFNLADNVPLRHTKIPNSSFHYKSFQASVYFMCFILGILLVILLFILTLVVENVTCYKIAWVLKIAKKNMILSFIFYASINALSVLFAVLMLIKYGPDSDLCGIPDIMAYLNGVDIPGVLLVRTFISKLFGVIGTVCGGLPLGKDGPFLHIGAMVAQFLSQGGSRRFRMNYGWLKLFKNDETRAELVACGSAAGLAAAFRSPVGGVMFLIEAIASFWYRKLLWKAFFTTAVVSISFGFISQVCQKNSCGYFHSLSIIFEIGKQGQQVITYKEILPVAFLGLVGGVISVVFIQINTSIHKWRRRVIYTSNTRRVLEVLLVSLFVSGMSFGLSLLRPCMPCSEEALLKQECPSQGNYAVQKYLNFNCKSAQNGDAPEAQYNDMASLILTYQNDAIRNLFSPRTNQEYTVQSLLYLFIYLFVSSVYCYGISVPGGLFVPGILIGASYGRLIGSLFKKSQSLAYIDDSTYALLGAASILGGLMRSPISICVILLEVTNNLGLIGQLTLVLLISIFVADGFGVDSIYMTHLKIKQIPILKKPVGKDPKAIKSLDVASKKIISFKKIESVQRVVEVLRTYHHQSFPVYDNVDEPNDTQSINGEEKHNDNVNSQGNSSQLDTRQQFQPFFDSDHNGAGASSSSWGEKESGDQKQQVLIGNIMRYHLIVLLRGQRVFQMDDRINVQSQRIAQKYDIREFDKPVSCLAPKIDEVGLNTKALELYINLGPYVNRSYQVIASGVSYESAFALFQTLTLRHLFVIPQPQQIVGVITRKDLIPKILESALQQNEMQSNVANPNQYNYGERQGGVNASTNGEGLLSGLYYFLSRQVEWGRKSLHDKKIQITSRSNGTSSSGTQLVKRDSNDVFQDSSNSIRTADSMPKVNSNIKGQKCQQ